MQRLTLEEFEARSGEYDQQVLARPDIDQFCSSSDWVLPANAAFGPRRQPWIWRGEHGTAAFMRERDADGPRLLQPLEATWCFACPLAGADAAALARDFARALRAAERSWDGILIGGVAEGSPLFDAVVAALSPRYRIGVGPTTRRHRADLSGGPEAFLARRPAGLRKTLRAARRRAAKAGVAFEAGHPASAADAPKAYDRILAVESRSWKGREGGGITEGRMREFYRLMLPRLAARKAARLMFARHEGKDVAYIFGGVFGNTYRGLQFSYDEAYSAFSLGHLAQLEQATALCAEGVSRYDLGQENPYKERWGEERLDTVTLLVRR